MRVIQSNQPLFKPKMILWLLLSLCCCSAFSIDLQKQHLKYNAPDATPLLDSFEQSPNDEDLDRQIHEEPEKQKRVRRSGVLSFFSHYYDVNEITDYLMSLNDVYPLITNVSTIGKTMYKNSLVVLKVGAASLDGLPKPFIWIDGLMHGNDWITGSTALYIANRLVTQYEFDPDVKRLVDYYDWYILPVANPDGYEYTHVNHRRNWRKNRTPFPDFNSVGVDLNRNFDYFWDTPKVHNPSSDSNDDLIIELKLDAKDDPVLGDLLSELKLDDAIAAVQEIDNPSSDNYKAPYQFDDPEVGYPSSDSYKGPYPFSELESTAIGKFLEHHTSALFYFSLRSSQEYVYIPSLNLTDQKKVENVKIGSVFVCPAFECEPNSGAAVEWAATYLRMFSYAIHLTDDEEGKSVPPINVMTVADQAWHAIETMTHDSIGREISLNEF